MGAVARQIRDKWYVCVTYHGVRKSRKCDSSESARDLAGRINAALKNIDSYPGGLRGFLKDRYMRVESPVPSGSAPRGPSDALSKAGEE